MPPFAERIPLAAALTALMAGITATDAGATGISTAALSSALARFGSALTGSAASGTDVVTSCADDGSGGTLRSAVSGAVSGDTIEMSGLPAANANCASGVITLTMGTISTSKDLTVVGPGADVLAIAAPVAGGRVFSSSGSQLEIDHLTIRGGRALTAGGCIYSTGAVTLQGSTVTDCQANYGGGAVAAGGGIFASAITVKDGSRISGNSATFLHNGKYAGAGGGLVANVVTCIDSTISDNHANQAGGGIVALSQVSITRCTIEGNTARAIGGGIEEMSSATQSSIVGSTISGNSAMKGGGIYTQAEFYIADSTIAFNSAVNGDAGGIFTGAYLTLQSSIVARNISVGSAHADLQSSAMVGGNDNLVESSTPTDPGVITVTGDPMLTALADNGGPTRTHALAAGSPAIDVGNNAAGATTDQRGAGFAREVPVGKPDIGAFEFRGDGIFYDGFD